MLILVTTSETAIANLKRPNTNDLVIFICPLGFLSLVKRSSSSRSLGKDSGGLALCVLVLDLNAQTGPNQQRGDRLLLEHRQRRSLRVRLRSQLLQIPNKRKREAG